MIHKICILFLLLSINNSLIAQVYNKQNTYLDALELTRIYKQNLKANDSNNQELKAAYFSILDKYGIDSANFKQNPFIRDLSIHSYFIIGNREKNKYKNSNISTPKPIKKGDFIKLKTATYQSSLIESRQQSPSISWEAASINGVSNFMASRFKQEVLHMGINQMFNKLSKKEDSNICKFLFPKSMKYINEIYSDGGQSYYSSDIMMLKHSALIDLEDIPSNIIENSVHIFPNQKNPIKTKEILQLSQNFMRNVINGYSLDKLISTLSYESYSDTSNLFKIIQLVDLISQATLNKSKENDYWVQSLTLKVDKKIDQEKIELRYFYALLYQQLTLIPELREYVEIANNKDDIQLSVEKMNTLIQFVDQLNRIQVYLKINNYKLNTVNDFNSYLMLYFKALVEFNNTLKKIPSMQKDTISSEQIGLCLKYFKVVDALQSKEYSKIIPTFILEFSPYLPVNKSNYRTLSFISQLSTIEKSEDMENLLTSYALPIGGASIKRNSNFNISFNSYVGLTSGAELAFASQQTQLKPNLGLAAPIGLSITGKKNLTLFFSILDLGSIVNQRFGNDTTSYSTLKLEHFFTPGVGLFYNFKKIPISIGAHGNYISNLRNIKYIANNAIITESNVSVIRLNFSVVVDIPFFTIFNAEK